MNTVGYPKGYTTALLKKQGTIWRFQRSDRRPALGTQFVKFMREAQVYGLIDAMVVDGSFVTAESVSHEIDLVGFQNTRCDCIGVPQFHKTSQNFFLLRVFQLRFWDANKDANRIEFCAFSSPLTGSVLTLAKSGT